MVERDPEEVRVGGSSPSLPTNFLEIWIPQYYSTYEDHRSTPILDDPCWLRSRQL